MIKHCRGVDDRLYDPAMSLSLSFLFHPITHLPSFLSTCLLLGLPSGCQLEWAKFNSQLTVNFGHLLPHPSLSVPFLKHVSGPVVKSKKQQAITDWEACIENKKRTQIYNTN